MLSFICIFSPVVLTVVSVATVAGVVLPDCELLSPLLEQPHKTEVSASMAAVTAQIVFFIILLLTKIF